MKGFVFLVHIQFFCGCLLAGGVGKVIFTGVGVWAGFLLVFLVCTMLEHTIMCSFKFPQPELGRLKYV